MAKNKVKLTWSWLDILVHTCNLSTSKVEAGGLPQVLDQPWLQCKTISYERRREEEKKRERGRDRQTDTYTCRERGGREEGREWREREKGKREREILILNDMDHHWEVTQAFQSAHKYISGSSGRVFSKWGTEDIMFRCYTYLILNLKVGAIEAC